MMKKVKEYTTVCAAIAAGRNKHTHTVSPQPQSPTICQAQQNRTEQNRKKR